MELDQIIQAINSEIAKLENVKRLLGGQGSTPVKRKPGRPAKATSFNFSGSVTAAAPKKRQHHTMSAEARARIAAAQKARWARLKKG